MTRIPEAWETENGWEAKVCQPIIDCPLSPRLAKRILELTGKMKAYGQREVDIANAMELWLAALRGQAHGAALRTQLEEQGK